MSLVAQAILTTTRHVLDGRTWAQGRVHEQPVDPIDSMLRAGQDTGKPVLAVYVEQVESEPVGRETQHGTRMVTLKVMAYISPSVTHVGDELEISFEADGAGLALNMLGRQVDAALHYGNPTWVKLWGDFVLRITGRKMRFLLVEVENAVRIPTAEIEYKLETVAEPDMGVPLFGAWLGLDTLLRTKGADEQQLADIIKEAIEQPEGLPDWQQFQVARNLSDAAFRATGLAPLAVDDEGEPVPLEDIISEPEVEIVPPELP